MPTSEDPDIKEGGPRGVQKGPADLATSGGCSWIKHYIAHRGPSDPPLISDCPTQVVRANRGSAGEGMSLTGCIGAC